MIFNPDILTELLVLAQDGAVPLGGGHGGADPANGLGPGAPRQPQGLFSEPIFMLLILFVLAFLMFSIFSQRKERKRREALLDSIRKHDRVQTIGGVIGSIVEVKNDQVVLKVDESSNTRITFARSAIQQVLSSGRQSGKSQDRSADTVEAEEEEPAQN